MYNITSKLVIVLMSVVFSIAGVTDKQEVKIDERMSNLITKSFKMPQIDWLIPKK